MPACSYKNKGIVDGGESPGESTGDTPSPKWLYLRNAKVLSQQQELLPHHKMRTKHSSPKEE